MTPNDLLFLAQTLVVLSFVLIAFRMGYVWMVGLMAAMAALMNIYVLKQMMLFGLVVTGGNVLYAALFLSTDLIGEHYGRAKALKAVFIGFFVSAFFLVTSQMLLAYTPHENDFVQPAFATIFDLTWRIVGASMLSYLITQTGDVYLFDKLRRATGGRMLWLRNCGSTMVSQFLDSAIFTFAAFYGNPDFKNLWEIILFTYIIKLIVAVIDTPFIYLSKHRLLTPAELRT